MVAPMGKVKRTKPAPATDAKKYVWIPGVSDMKCVGHIAFWLGLVIVCLNLAVLWILPLSQLQHTVLYIYSFYTALLIIVVGLVLVLKDYSKSRSTLIIAMSLTILMITFGFGEIANDGTGGLFNFVIRKIENGQWMKGFVPTEGLKIALGVLYAWINICYSIVRMTMWFGIIVHTAMYVNRAYHPEEPKKENGKVKTAHDDGCDKDDKAIRVVVNGS